jgi:hypothetical protein
MNQGLKARSIPGWRHPRWPSQVWFMLNRAIVGQPREAVAEGNSSIECRRRGTKSNFGIEVKESNAMRETRNWPRYALE